VIYIINNSLGTSLQLGSLPKKADSSQVSMTGKAPGLKLGPVLSVSELTVSFIQYARGLKQNVLTVINGLSVELFPGEIVAVVGSSGSGKSLLAHAILGILPGNAFISGDLLYEGEELTEKRQKALRGKEIAFVPQSVNYLDPLMKVGAQVRAAVKQGSKRDVQQKIFKRYHLDSRVEGLYPFQLSGGMARRVLVAGALVGNARLIIADEPTPGLHPQVVKETLNHLRELSNEGRAVMLITHDIKAALDYADRIAVFYAGATLETAAVADFSGDGSALRHPYSKMLWKALPQNDFAAIPGFQPVPGELPQGCLFAPRCQMAEELCRKKRPAERDLRDGKVRCHYAT
jgi:peptide/nickel transport system ATP-binding protein